jgi:site-specific DNA-methyltransferase (cytosine-N4-specific)
VRLLPKVPHYSTVWGAAYVGDALELMRQMPANSISLVLTSPPFALRRQKAYGNVDAASYVDWFWPFAEQIHRLLKPDGSFVLDIAGAWNPGSPTRSLLPYQLIIKLCELFHLAQECYWFNPSKLPTPAQWVTVNRLRLKDAVNYVWWLSKTEYPNADNSRVLKPYSRSMKRLLRDGYKPEKRPSQHDLSKVFQKDNGGAIPPNIQVVPNTRSNDAYFRRCRALGLPIHPARFPDAVPEFFIKLLTHPRQMVLDPFAGSNVTGHVAEGLNRRWISFEIDAKYVEGSRLRFEPAAKAG